MNSRGKSKIVQTLSMMCESSNPQDKKLLLLAELVEDKCDSLYENQENLKESLSSTNKKLDELTSLLKKYSDHEEYCPVNQNKEAFKYLAMILKYPKLLLLIIIGLFVTLGLLKL